MFFVSTSMAGLYPLTPAFASPECSPFGESGSLQPAHQVDRLGLKVCDWLHAEPSD